MLTIETNVGTNRDRYIKQNRIGDHSTHMQSHTKNEKENCAKDS